MQQISIPKYYYPGDYENISVATDAISALTASKLKNSSGKPVQMIEVTVETKSIRWSIVAGVDPTTGAAGTGHPLVAGDTRQFIGYGACKNLQMIGLDGTAAVHVTYYY